MGDRRETALVLAPGHLGDVHGKTAHALIRGPSRYLIVGVVDPERSGEDAGAVVDGRERGIPVFGDVGAALAALPARPDRAIVGVATGGGVLPPALRQELLAAARAGLHLVNGLHSLLEDDEEIATLARRHGGRIVDVRRPVPPSRLHFWSGTARETAALRVPVLGTDCAVGKRTTCTLLVEALRSRGIPTELVYTGQTGWLQGWRYGFILDATPNDFVCGELEHEIVRCDREATPRVILIEGQSGLRNPSGPCGSELIIAAAADGVLLVHPAGRTTFIENPWKVALPEPRDEIELIERLGAPVWGLALNHAGLHETAARKHAAAYRGALRIPVALPLLDGVEPLAAAIAGRLAKRDA